jgi:hypothetical protein
MIATASASRLTVPTFVMLCSLRRFGIVSSFSTYSKTRKNAPSSKYLKTQAMPLYDGGPDFNVTEAVSCFGRQFLS